MGWLTPSITFTSEKSKGETFFKTGDIHAIFVWVRTPLMERVDPAHRTEEMPCRSRVKAVLGELILTFGHPNP